ncbi:MAG: hypothetical protein B0D96_07690 [Candidatus Sedimenticola endophacoides]|uniref:Flagellar motor protein MotB n=1 Tax=Candidatus Sedimenticola endophacoides TaxID=2548426 RepID=A0A657Q4A4_9GAMM|nr:MAG: hypothetical protein B0D94_12465 [Candidatus Sedimenticola endophacoides]OQX34400.1 MAG: hypothetical protein B0D84_03480 [Candidatus Sedimenticola endophacoides]OQX35052.1 MAG: hypothetical protein B0D96_07690 [Candidatus Sedimenticola endophacoides]OQX40393.1 MAG: hypothetical protein B0D89_07860 [Candidatus Sedimenticola endophacoides]OQX42338.1 MAG: hypothetical protein B0D82_01220 [Candidatus Sedimenticola endophacoides]
MSADGGFIDLRLNRQERQSSDGFWPSFTDIMTVILMIFMIAMVVLLLRNMELVKQLRATMEAERAAMELARTTGEEKESLALKLIASENELSMLRIRLMQMKEESNAQIATIGNQSDEIATLMADIERLTLRRDQLTAENFTLGESLKRARAELESTEQSLASLEQSLASLKQQHAERLEELQGAQLELTKARNTIDSLQSGREVLESQLAGMRDRITEQSSELQTAKAASRLSDRELASLRLEYSDLKVKYDELVRPARSPEGRFVVDIRYGKSNGAFTIEYQTALEPGYKLISREELEQRLGRLKQQHSNGLYVKVIFPEQSGLSFNEAWTFTSDLHNRYDYYYQNSGSTPSLPKSPQQP